jgi:hypothetical protein
LTLPHLHKPRITVPAGVRATVPPRFDDHSSALAWYDREYENLLAVAVTCSRTGG